MRRNKFLRTLLLLPLSKIYGMVVYVRNRLFDWHVLKSRKFDVPVVVVGNIAVGGTGKTPHTEYVIETLRNEYRIGVLSRGYKRHTKGFILAGRCSTPWDIGDEPYQIYQKYNEDVKVAVCESRTKGITELLRLDPSINLVVLDDAFQHRYVEPRVSIVLTEWNRPVYNDDLLPLGRLREPAYALNRASMVVVTKCPDEIKPLDVRMIYDHLNLFAFQPLYFSHYVYGNLVSVFPEEVTYTPAIEWLTPADGVLVLSGIANPKHFIKYFRRRRLSVQTMQFPDHHNFSRRDFERIIERFDELGSEHRYIITTEKDAVRIANNPYYPPELRPYTFYVPIKVEFLPYSMTPSGSAAPFAAELRELLKGSKRR